LLRYNLGGALVRNARGAEPDIEKILPLETTPEAACDLLSWRLFQAPMSTALREKTMDFLKNNGRSPASHRDLIHLLMSTPDFQLT
jgi:hypothetical protein